MDRAATEGRIRRLSLGEIRLEILKRNRLGEFSEAARELGRLCERVRSLTKKALLVASSAKSLSLTSELAHSARPSQALKRLRDYQLACYSFKEGFLQAAEQEERAKPELLARSAGFLANVYEAVSAQKEVQKQGVLLRRTLVAARDCLECAEHEEGRQFCQKEKFGFRGARGL